MKKIFFLFSFLVLGLGSVSAQAQEPSSNKPYKATTVDECIQEKECVWYMFINQIYKLSSFEQVFARGHITKWSNEIRLAPSGKNEKNYLKSIAEAVEELSPYLKYEVKTVSSKPNYQIIIANDIKTEIGRLEKALGNILGQNAKGIIGGVERSYEGCFTILLDNQRTKDIILAFTLVDAHYKDVKHCIAIEFYSALGFAGSLKHQQFSFLGDKSYGHFTKLDKFLVYLLYRDEFKSGHSFEQTTKIFNKIFTNAKKDFLELEEKN